MGNYSYFKGFISKGEHGRWGNNLQSLVNFFGKKYTPWLKDILAGRVDTLTAFENLYPEIVETTRNSYVFKKEVEMYGNKARDPLVYNQDLGISVLVEDMIAYGVEGLKRNPNSTAGEKNNGEVNTNEDYLYGDTVGVELKTRYSHQEDVVFRLKESDKLVKNKSLVLTYFPYEKKMYLTDFYYADMNGKLYETVYYGKPSKGLHLKDSVSFDYDLGVTSPTVIKENIDKVLATRRGQ